MLTEVLLLKGLDCFLPRCLLGFFRFEMPNVATRLSPWCFSPRQFFGARFGELGGLLISIYSPKQHSNCPGWLILLAAVPSCSCNSTPGRGMLEGTNQRDN